MAILFSVLSLVLTLFEYSTKKYLLKAESVLFVQFRVHSKEIALMSRRKFMAKIEYKRYSISNHVAKILGIDYAFVELLKPIAFKEGAILTFAIRNDEYSSKYHDQQDMSGGGSGDSDGNSNRCYRIDLERDKNVKERILKTF